MPSPGTMAVTVVIALAVVVKVAVTVLLTLVVIVTVARTGRTVVGSGKWLWVDLLEQCVYGPG
jgi:hypothetical protein